MNTNGERIRDTVIAVIAASWGDEGVLLQSAVKNDRLSLTLRVVLGFKFVLFSNVFVSNACK